MADAPARYLVTVADDFGSSPSVNGAVAQAHDQGVLTGASLMATSEAFEEAVEVAKQRSSLSVGLHVTLCDGRSVLPHSLIPGLVGPDGRFEKDPSHAWMKYTRPGLRKELALEVSAQFDRLKNSGIHPTHVDGHHHLHMHPAVFAVLCEEASRRGIKWVRVPNESFSEVVRHRLGSRGAMPFVEWAVLGALGRLNLQRAARYNMRSADSVYGLSRTGGADKKFLLDVMMRTTGTITEVFMHPDLATEHGRTELEALTSNEAREMISSLGLTSAGYGRISHAERKINLATESE